MTESDVLTSKEIILEAVNSDSTEEKVDYKLAQAIDCLRNNCPKEIINKALNGNGHISDSEWRRILKKEPLMARVEQILANK